ncbi:branched-chain amino acid ABC transporter permease [Alphaproteobacteria bacterium]|nr:branched-chain amino acid ABC transporter permease [Alphaproteobacteria bacterium]
MAVLIVFVGVFQSWGVALSILNLCLISAVMSIGVNIQWGYAGLINFGVMGFTALGGLAAVLVSVNPVREAWSVGGIEILVSIGLVLLLVLAIKVISKKIAQSKKRNILIGIIIVLFIVLIRTISGPAIEAIESVNPATQGFLGGLGLPIIFSWIVGGLFAALVAFVIGKVALGLRSDYLAIATLLISGIIVSIVKHEDWLSRGVKNVIGMKRPAPYEIDLQQSEWFINLVTFLNSSKLNSINDVIKKEKFLNQLVIDASTIFVKLCFAGLFSTVVIILLILTQKALYSPWGRMMRAIRDNEEAAKAMGKNVVKQHLNIFIIGSSIIGMAGAMLVTYDGLFTPVSYQPLRYTFLIWIMVIIGGTGNNYGSVLGAFIVWFLWIEAAPISLFLINILTSNIDHSNEFKKHLINSVPYFRFIIMGIGLLFIMRYRPKGLLPEKIKIQKI